MARGQAAHLPRAPRPASARPSPCSTRAAARTSAAPTSSSASSRPTAGRTPPRRSATSRSSRGDGSTYRGHDVRGDGRRRGPRPATRGGAGRRAGPHQRARARATRSAGRTSRSCSTPGIDVISTVNIQHLESLNDVVEQITGIKQRETIPDAVVRAADQVELVDMTPEALRRRMAHGNIYAPEKVDAALGNYFRLGNLGALRELALMWVADRVDEALAGVPRAARHRRHLGDARAGRRRHHRRARRRPPHPPGRPHGRARPTASSRRPRAADRRPGRAGRRRGSTSTAGCSRSSAASTTRSSAPTSPRRSCSSPGPRTRPSSCSAPAAGRAGTS